MQGDS